ncbi:MAG TPA: ribonuclease PH [Thermomicrobiales bacterium]|nr:ribonuclease PH [Thermomicrobiales bacterium]
MSSTISRTGRATSELRPVTIETGVAPYAEGSALIACGNTRVWCTATVEERVPPWLTGKGQGWVTAEYSMLPRSTHTRINRDRASGSGRSQEISRLIGRSLRAGIDLKRLGERMITVDCDVLQADGGTRTAAITGGFVALELACRMLAHTRVIPRSPITDRVAAVSAGIIAGEPRLDLDYQEDSAADVDCNVVMDARGRIIELQSTAERSGLTREHLGTLLDMAAAGIEQLMAIQRAAVEGAAR